MPASGLARGVHAAGAAHAVELAALRAERGHGGGRGHLRHLADADPILWQDIESFRRLWSGKLVLKGVMHPDDATRAAAIGVDGIMVSNHGARQLDRAPSPIDVLPAINAAVGER